ncbi:MAG: SIS domain-containing protein [Oscillospiraceae bacterium]|nr:SIS domain-containing protein [Oscillospiraceae bacterium]
MERCLKPETIELVNALLDRQNELCGMEESIHRCVRILADAFAGGNKLLLCGNGGSCADCDHIAGELLKGFLKKRPIPDTMKKELEERYGDEGLRIAASLQCGLPAISLCTHSAAISAFANDVDPEYVYAQQVLAYGKEGDILLAISTSGNAKNVNAAVKTAKAMGLLTIGLTGSIGGQLARNADLVLAAPCAETNWIQEYHLMIYHLLCAAVEEELFDS